MKRLLLLFLLTPLVALSQNNFEKHFTENSLRIDFELAGNADEEFAILQSMKQEPHWGGNQQALIPKYNMGDYRITIKNLDEEILYSKGFNSLFREWQTISEAQKINRSFHHAIQLPYPRDSVIVSINSRQKDGKFQTLLKWEVNPKDYLITQDKTPHYPIDTLSYAGNSSDYLDLVFIAEAYTKDELTKFQKDVQRFKQWIFSVAPFTKYKNNVNIYAILAPSQDSGPDVPGDSIYQNTLLNASFYTFNSPRYLTIRDTKKMYDIAAQVPYDHVYVIVNTEIYGGAGFYNTYTSCASDCRNAEEIASHELCHGLIGLADEYYTNGDEINYYYNLDIEPWEPNITTLIDFSKKWKHLVNKDIPIPTPRIPKYEDELGAFEGGAYQSKGIYSPMQDCKMKTNNTNELCPACQEAVHKIMQTYINN
ncbi:M64 family metallopeptidase [Balneicella halophila]|nr:M64 family metallopeptidase [Balneicella halophila]